MSNEIVTGVFTILGVAIGAAATHWNDKVKSKREQKIRAFVKLAGIKLPLVQAMQTNAEAQLLTEYYEARAYMLSAQNDMEEAKAQNARMLSLIPETIKQRSIFSEAVAEIKISFDINAEINQLLHHVYKGPSFTIGSVVNRYNTEAELDEWKNECSQSINNHLQQNYTEKIERIIEKIYPEFEQL